ncbi:uracil phosphoribosyltransferase [Zavarzinella formosa]|uniref:uracil phosphoribosyltransferase n=1 Tax=Zavarzinella formosa TaxID=360055 RepID=UPI00030F2DAF|nr:uracil phosphoribosyltransferase [Zavarzinella formosa]
MVKVSKHPLVKHKVALLRDAKTEPMLFRNLVGELGQLLFVEATADLETTAVTVRTPLADCPSEVIWQRVGIIPILRAGLSMAEAMLHILPKSVVWHLGLFRDHETHQPITYYNKLPPQPNIDVGYIVDPMLATGGSASAAVSILKNWGLKDIRFIGLIAAPEGVTVLQNDHPDVRIHLAAMDSHLNENAYIVPGLGDAGDRQFGTF